jgi:hypothetical protein
VENITVLVSTDETDKICRLSTMQHMLEAYPHAKARNLDDLAWKHSYQYAETRSGSNRDETFEERVLNDFFFTRCSKSFNWNESGVFVAAVTILYVPASRRVT